MTVQWTAVRLLQHAMLLWVIGFILSAYLGLDALNVMGLSPLYAPPGPLKFITHGLALLPDGINDIVVLIAIPMLLMLCLRDLFRAPRWWSALVIWFLYTNLMNKAWLAGSGGQQLIANLLFWNIPLSWTISRKEHQVVAFSAFWILRLQVLLAYFATGLHKLTGSLWLEGKALGVVATDTAFGPEWLAGMPALSIALTWSVLVFQLTFPLAVWFRVTRNAWMLFGIAFHLGTAVWMDIPEMGAAFIVAYSIWCDERTVMRLAPLRWLALGSRDPRQTGSSS